MSRRFTKLESHIMDALWTAGPSSIRDIQESFPQRGRPAYTTVQTTVYRLETKGAVRRVRKISNAHIFEAIVSRQSAQRRMLDDLLSFFGGRSQPVIAQLIEAGKLTMEDIHDAEKALKAHARKEKSK
jgi:BlaI family penicillinase repressor